MSIWLDGVRKCFVKEVGFGNISILFVEGKEELEVDVILFYFL